MSYEENNDGLESITSVESILGSIEKDLQCSDESINFISQIIHENHACNVCELLFETKDELINHVKTHQFRQTTLDGSGQLTGEKAKMELCLVKRKTLNWPGEIISRDEKSSRVKLFDKKENVIEVSEKNILPFYEDCDYGGKNTELRKAYIFAKRALADGVRPVII